MNDLAKANSPMYPMSDIEQMATIMAKSRMFGFRNIEEAISLMLMAQAEGMHPAKAAQRYHVIQGRPALKAEAMLAGFQAAGGRIKVDEKTDTRVAVWFSHPTACPEPVLIDWTMDRAKNAGLTGKDTWNKYPRQMLYARVVSEGVRTCYPGVLNGMYTPEEVVEFDDGPRESSTFRSAPPHISKAEVLASELKSRPDGEDTPNIKVSPEQPEKTRGSKTDVIERIKRATTESGIGRIVSKQYKEHTFTKSERDEIEAAAEYKIDMITASAAEGGQDDDHSDTKEF